MQPKRILGLLLAFGMLVLMAGVVLTTSTSWIGEHSSPATVRWALAFNPPDAELWRLAARSGLLSLDDTELRESADQYRQALQRNPLDPTAWEGLANIGSRLSDGGREEAVLRGWLAAVPHSARASWSLANLLLRQDRTEEAIPYFRGAATDDFRFRAPLFELAWKILDDPQRILHELVPDNNSGRVDYLYFLAGPLNKPLEALPVWKEIRDTQGPEAKETAMYLAEQLASRGRGIEASKVWKESGTPLPPSPGQRRNLVYNGDFEQPLISKGLDWRVTPQPGWQISMDDFQAASGSRSLRITFDGTTNPEFAAVGQWVIVEPDKDYRFTGQIKTDNLTTDNGIYFSLTTVNTGSGGKEFDSPVATASTPWTTQTVDFHTGPDTTVLLLRARRTASSKLNNLLRGKVWLDDVSLVLR